MSEVRTAINEAIGDVIIGTVHPNDCGGLSLQVDGCCQTPLAPAFPACDPSGRILGHRGVFRVPVPEVSEPREARVRLVRYGQCLDEKQLLIAPIVHASGISARDVLALHKFPLVAPNGIAMHAGLLEMTGLALAPYGDASRVSVKVDGLETGFDFLYPLPSRDAQATYWYWPNADYATFKISIDLRARQRRFASPHYRIEFSFDAEDSPLRHLKNCFYVPKSMAAYETFPGNDRLQRVQRFENAHSVAVRGYSDCMRIASLARHYGLSSDGVRVLDWGCGHGRVIRHFCSLEERAVPTGIDIDADNIRWAQENLPEVAFSVGPLMPPTAFAEGAFDLVYGISVMTHLTADVQIAWLREIRRILAPGGLALLTFAGDTSVAFASRYLDPVWIANYRRYGSGADLPSNDLEGLISDPSYYKNVKLSAAAVAQRCGEFFEVLDVLECMFGYQDVAVLRRPFG